MLALVLSLREKNDPLCTSMVGVELFNKLHGEIRKLKTDYYPMNRVGSPQMQRFPMPK